MSAYQRIHSQQLLREVEGYLDLLTVFAGRWEPGPQARDRLCHRALAQLERLEKTGAHRAEVLYLKGQAYRTMEQYAQAIRPLREASELDGDNLHVWLALGWCYKRTERLDLAIEALEEALASDPLQAIIHYNLACYWSLAGNAKLAVAYLGRAFDLDGEYRELVAEENDFDPIRSHPEFLALTSVIV